MAEKKQTRRGFGRLRELLSGRWQAAYTSTVDGRLYRAPETFATKVDAEGWLAQERRLIDLETWTPPAERDAAKATGGLTLRVYADCADTGATVRTEWDRSGDDFTKNAVRCRLEGRFEVGVSRLEAIVKIATASE